MQTLKDEVKKNIIEAATREFLEKGFRQASMRKIAKGADVSVSNVYNYFRGKTHLFAEVVKPAVNELAVIREEIKKKEGFRNVKQSKEMIKKITLFRDSMDRFINSYHREIVILFDRSRGTKYERIKREMIIYTAKHFISKVNMVFDNKIHKNYDAKFILHIIANNLIESIAEICRHYKGERWVQQNLEMYLDYHLAGMVSFMIKRKNK